MTPTTPAHAPVAIQERILAEYRSDHSHVIWLATNKGVIRQDRRLGKTRFSFLPHKSITSVVFERQSNVLMLVLAIVVLLCFSVLFVIEDLSAQFEQALFSLLPLDPFSFWMYIPLLLATVFALLWYLSRTTGYHFTGAGIDKNIWSVSLHRDKKEQEMNSFIAVVRKYL